MILDSAFSLAHDGNVTPWATSLGSACVSVMLNKFKTQVHRLKETSSLGFFISYIRASNIWNLIFGVLIIDVSPDDTLV